MADEKIVTSIVANSDFSNLIADVQRVTISLSRLQQEFAGSNRALAGQIDATNAMFKESMLKTGQFSSHFVSLTSDVEKFGRNLDSGRLKLRDYFRVYQEHARTSGGLIRDLAKQQVQLQNAVLQPLGRNAQGLMQYNVHIPRGLDLTKNKASLLKQELQIMNKVIQDGGVQLINWGKNTQWAGRQLTVGLTLPLAAFGKAAADAFKVADQELTRLTKVYGDIAGSSAQELNKIRNEVSATAKELSSAMGVSFTETIGLAADIAATGKTGNELLASVSETTRLAVLGEVDRQEAMKATLAIQSAFKQNTEQLAESINFLNAVENQTSTTLNDLVEAIPKAGPVIKGLGGSVQDLALYLTAMREGGINASEGANALKSALASLINPTDVAVGKFQSFGIDLLGIVNKNAGNVTETLLALQSALDTLNPLQKQQAIEQLFGKFQFSRLNALFENLGRQGSQTLQVLDLMKASAGELEAVAGRELAAVTESASGRYRRAVEGLKAELAGVGDEFLDIGTKLINVLSKIIDFSQKLPDPIKKVLAFGGAFTAIIGPVIMLTGVLANFFGYIIKGLGHFKALFKGAEGFKLLTPEIMAARAASAQLADEFYSDAAAADTLRLAIRKLNEDLISLRTNAGSINLQSGLGEVVSTTAGTPIMTVGGGRVVDPNHPLLGGESRAAAHLNPRDPRNPSTIFGLTMQPIPVNRKLGRTPQILMTERLPDIEGLTSAGGISTGVVAGEHARYAALMATLGVQSRQEIEQLKKTINLGGQVSKEFIDTFDDILPITQRLTQNAAAQSSVIVAQLRAGKLNIEQARAAIISANADLERMMGIEISAYAASRGRTIDLTKAPLIDQPVVDSRGKPNVRGMFRQGIFARVMSAVGRATRTRTFGGPYSIETTKPPGLNQGGKVPGYINGDYVYMTNGETVPGPNVNADVVPAMLTPGEFVLTRGTVAREGSDAVEALHRGEATIVPFNANSGGAVPASLAGGLVSAMRGGYGPRPTLAVIRKMLGAQSPWEKTVSRRTLSVRGTALPRHYFTTGTGAHPSSRRTDLISSHDAGWKIKDPATGNYYTKEQLQSLDDDAVNTLWSGIDRSHFATAVHKTDTGQYIMPALFGPQSRYGAGGNLSLNTGGDPKLILQTLEGGLMHPFSTMISSARMLGYPPKQIDKLFKDAWTEARVRLKTRGKKFGKDSDTFEEFMEGILQRHLKKLKIPNTGVNYFDEMRKIGNLRGSGISGSGPAVYRSDNPDFSFAAANLGGMIPGYNFGGMVRGYNDGGGISRAGLLARLGAKFKYTGKSYDGPQSLRTYNISAMDINGGKKYFSNIPGLSDKGKGALYNATLDYFNTSGIKGDKVNGKRLFNSNAFLPAMPVISSFALSANRNWMSPGDIAILESMSGKSRSLREAANLSAQALHPIHKRVFGANRGGMVPGYNRGGSVYGYARGVQNKFAGGMILKLLAALGVSQAGQMVGQKVGGGAGTAISTASSFLPFMMMPGIGGASGNITVGQRLGFSAAEPIGKMSESVFAKSTPVLGKFATGLGNAATSGNILTKTLSKLLIGISRFTGVIGIATGATYGLYKIWKNYNETQRLSAAAFGLTAESAQKAGLQYTDYAQKIKDAVDAQKLMLDQNKFTYASMASAGTPFKMTIAEYKKLRKELKETMAEQIKVINATPASGANRLAVQLKEQLVAAGLSAEEATKRIYTLFNLSDKSRQSLSAINTDAFRQIVDAQTAAASALQSFNYAKNFENTRDAASALNTALTAINTGVEDLIAKSEKAAQKKGQEFDRTKAAYEAEKKQLDIIANKVRNQEAIGQGVLNQLKKQNPEIEKFVNSQDTAVSIFEKLRLVARGFTGDIQSLNAQQTDAVYKLQIATSQAVETVNQKGLLSTQYKAYNELKKQRDALAKAAKGQSVQEQIDTKERLKALDKEIKRINDKAEARKKALREEAQAEDIALRIQQQRLEYEKMVAAGDFGGAATAQLELRRLTNEQQITLAEQQIEEQRLRKVGPLERERERIQAAQEKLGDKAALAAESLESINKRLGNQKEKIDAVNNAMTNLKVAMDRHKEDLTEFKQSKEFKGLAADFVKAVRETGQTVASRSLPDVAQGMLREDIGGLGADLLATYGSEINTIIASKGVTVTSTGDIVINGKKTSMSEGKRNIPEPSPLETSAAARAGSGTILAFDTETGKWTFTTPSRITDQMISYSDWQKGKKKYVGGGPVSGPGTGTSDSIPAWLSNGEYVFSEKAVRNAGGTEAVDELHQYLRKNSAFKDGGPVGDKVNLNGQMFRINNKNLEQIFSDIESAFAAEPNVKSFKDRADYFKALEEWDNKYSFVLPPKKSYPALGQDLPMGSLRRFLAIANSQAVGGMSSSSFNADITQHAYKMFSPRSFMGKKELLSDPKNFIDNLSEISNLNKFSLWANKNYKIGNDLIAWCGAFIAWVAQQSGVDVSKNMFSAFRATKEYKSLGKFKDPSKIGLNAGDIVWWDFDLGLPKNERVSLGVPDHVDIITKILGRSKIETIGGGFGGGVGKRIKDLSKEGNTLYGSVTPDFKSFKNGGYVGKLHDWNGAVPGPYGKEVSAVLKAGTEGVYQTDYIKSLQNGTMGGDIKINNSFVVNAAPGMNTDDIVNKVAVKVEEATRRAIRKSGTEVNINRRYM